MAIFKKGDRVSIARGPNNGGFGAIGDVGTIATVDGTACEVRFETGKEAGDVWWVGHDYLKLVPAATLTIQAGKCYRTRDGRKVGPMDSVPYHQQWTDSAGRAGVYRTDGSGDYSVDGIWLTADDDCTRHNLVAEWIDEPAVAGSNDNGPAPVAGQPAARFKVGDRVLDVHATEITAVVRAILPGNRIQVEWDNHPGLIGTWSADGFELVQPTTTRAIVCLIEDGQPKPADQPHVHTSRSVAEREATRLAGKHKGKAFGVFELVTTKREAAPVYAHEWQRLAAGGQRIAAIKELRAITGLYLAPARMAVEDWLVREAA